MSILHSSRRQFLAASAATAAAAVIAAPAIATASRTLNEVIVGEGDYKFRVNHAFAQLPDKYFWQITHNVALDKVGNLYVIHEGKRELKDHPSIFVFDPMGKFIRAFGCQFQGGGHGIEVRDEGSEEFLYVAAYQQVKAFAKLTLTGETVWMQKAPMESGVYAPGENLSTEPNWTRQGFLPTNFAFLDDGGFLLADGYGTFQIHRFDKDAKWVSCFGGAGEGEGKFNTAHGLWIDRREGREPSIVVTDRAHNTLQIFTMDGVYKETLPGFGLPANIDTWKNLMLVPELKACVTLLNEENKVVARLGQATERLAEISGLRGQPDKWIDGQFVHPHDACFAPNGDIYVAEWVATGRVTKLERV
ncbi:MAG TPA: twin-arginine translocation signal domain-containing protein [Planctomycetaceae bacterium]|nr:twin-arginine translocation signal domain-containing protein [Planctomycetaceae bacterium]HQZ66851.1 twin-arginine translocation signal domain-containing protein [Planctomycetaceae bacterium]